MGRSDPDMGVALVWSLLLSGAPTLRFPPVTARHRFLRARGVCRLAVLAGMAPAMAQDPSPCPAIDDDAQRLRCCDAKAGRPIAAPAFSGYGYKLLDDDHRQTTVGVGFLLTDRL